MISSNIRKIRLSNEYKEMLEIKDTPTSKWETDGSEQEVEDEYIVTLYTKTYSTPDILIDECQLKITFPENYPFESPIIQVVNTPLFNPLFNQYGFLENISFDFNYSLVDCLEYIFYALQFQPGYIPEDAVSNSTSVEWYLSNKDNKALFPCDKKEFCRPLCKDDFDKNYSAESNAQDFSESDYLPTSEL